MRALRMESEEPLEHVCVCVCVCFSYVAMFAAYAHSLVDRKQLVRGLLVRYYIIAATIDNNPHTTSEPPNDAQPSISQNKSILQRHWWWAKCCCCWYCSENCRRSRLLAGYKFVVAMMKAIEIAHASLLRWYLVQFCSHCLKTRVIGYTSVCNVVIWATPSWQHRLMS